MAPPKILVVLTSVDKIPKTGQLTGWYLVRPYLPSPLLPCLLKLTPRRARSPTPSTSSTQKPS